MTTLRLALVATAAVSLAVGCTASPGNSRPAADTTTATPASGYAADTQPMASPAVPAAPASATVTDASMIVYKDRNCGCCNDWVTHMRRNGFTVDARDVNDLDAVKQRMGVPRRLQSCHTGEIAGYVIEGHVPADLVQRLLRERPAVAGIAVPGMPMGSPGMEGPYSEPYDIIAFTRGGATSVYATR